VTRPDLRLTESVTYSNRTLHLAYDLAGVPTHGHVAGES
jgi:hypothetical protein